MKTHWGQHITARAIYTSTLSFSKQLTGAACRNQQIGALNRFCFNPVSFSCNNGLVPALTYFISLGWQMGKEVPEDILICSSDHQCFDQSRAGRAASPSLPTRSASCRRDWLWESWNCGLWIHVPGKCLPVSHCPAVPWIWFGWASWTLKVLVWLKHPNWQLALLDRNSWPSFLLPGIKLHCYWSEYSVW